MPLYLFEFIWICEILICTNLFVIWSAGRRLPLTPPHQLLLGMAHHNSRAFSASDHENVEAVRQTRKDHRPSKEQRWRKLFEAIDRNGDVHSGRYVRAVMARTGKGRNDPSCKSWPRSSAASSLSTGAGQGARSKLMLKATGRLLPLPATARARCRFSILAEGRACWLNIWRKGSVLHAST